LTVNAQVADVRQPSGPKVRIREVVADLQAPDPESLAMNATNIETASGE
jgi:hypothetical protein